MPTPQPTDAELAEKMKQPPYDALLSEVIMLRAERAAKDAEIERLKADCEVMREALESCHAINCSVRSHRPCDCGHKELKDKALSTNPGASLLEELDEARNDKERLDWLERVREALDAAMRKDK